MPVRLLSFVWIASLSSNIPEPGVYFVYPSFIACFPASIICSGVLKSGSPTPKLITSSP